MTARTIVRSITIEDQPAITMKRSTCALARIGGHSPGASFFAVAAASLFLLTSCGPKLTDAHLAKIDPGMSAQQVEDIIGQPDEEHHREALGFTGTTLVYHTKTSDVKILLVDDQVIAVEGKPDSK